MGLFRKELGRVFFSLAFVAALAGILIFLYSQSVLPGSDKITAPEPGGPYGAYGMKDSGDPALIMPEAAEMLYIEYSCSEASWDLRGAE